MIGGDLPSSDPATIALFTNGDVLAVHARSNGNREVFREGPLVIWAADGPAGERYVAVFNRAETPLDVVLDAGDVGIAVRPDSHARELWTGAPVPVVPVHVQSDDARGVAPGSAALYLTLDPHGSALLRA
jgi:hypothetical protein